MKVLVTGTTGYIGGRLVPRLLDEGHEVRVLVRDPRRIEGRAWADAVDAVAGDLADPESLRRGLQGMEGAYYLVHSMYETRDFAERDRRLARNFAEAARAAGVRSVVYLGGLLPRADDVSEHLRSRAEVGETPADDGVVEPGMKVTTRFVGDDEVETFLLGAREIETPEDLEVYSPQSPLGSAIIGKKRGDEVDFEAPNGKVLKVEIVDAVPYTGA